MCLENVGRGSWLEIYLFLGTVWLVWILSGIISDDENLYKFEKQSSWYLFHGGDP